MLIFTRLSSYAYCSKQGSIWDGTRTGEPYRIALLPTGHIPPLTYDVWFDRLPFLGFVGYEIATFSCSSGFPRSYKI